MQDHFKESEFIIRNLQFDYLGRRYTGRGVMTWKPSTGFYIEAPLDPLQEAETEEVEFGRFRVTNKKDISSIKLFIEGYTWVVTSPIPLIDRDDVILQQRLSIRLRRMTFLQHSSYSSSEDIRGSALFETRGTEFLSDKLTREEKISIGDKAITHKREMSVKGFHYKGSLGQEVVGYAMDKKHLRFYWSLPRNQFTKNYGWKMAESIQTSLSILLGQQLNLLERRVSCGEREYIQICKQEEVVDLDYLRLTYDKLLSKSHFIRITEFLTNRELGSDVCKNILEKLVRAAQETDWQIREFIVSSILEAALRNICNQPFNSKKSKDEWSEYKGLKSFFENFLPGTWVPIHERVVKEFSYLRHRSAHPDWLFTQGGSLSKEEMEKSLDAMIFLSRFYGYMILALAGIKDLEPIFPSSHVEWRAPIKILPASLSNSTDEV